MVLITAVFASRQCAARSSGVGLACNVVHVPDWQCSMYNNNVSSTRSSKPWPIDRNKTKRYQIPGIDYAFVGWQRQL